MARQKAKQNHHAVEGRKKRYRLKLDHGLHHQLQSMAGETKPRYKMFVASWEKFRELRNNGNYSEIETARRNDILLNFVIVAHALMQKYDSHLKKPERENKHERYLQRMTKVFRIVASEAIQTQLGKSELELFEKAMKSMDAIRVIAQRHHLPTQHIP